MCERVWQGGVHVWVQGRCVSVREEVEWGGGEGKKREGPEALFLNPWLTPPSCKHPALEQPWQVPYAAPVEYPVSARVVTWHGRAPVPPTHIASQCHPRDPCGARA